MSLDSGHAMCLSNVCFALLLLPSAVLSELPSVTPTSDLSATLRTAIRKSSEAKELEGRGDAFHSLLNAEPGASATPAPRAALHISLSRPLMLQTNQRDELRVAVAQVASKHSW